VLLAVAEGELCKVEVGVVLLVVVIVDSTDGKLLLVVVMKCRFRPPQVTTPPSRVVHEPAEVETDAKAELEAEGEIEAVAETEVEAEAEGETEGEADAESVAAPVVVYEDVSNAELLVDVLRLTPSPLQFTTPPKRVVQVLEGAATETLTIAPVVTVVVKAMYTVVAPPAAGVAVDTDARSVFDPPPGHVSCPLSTLEQDVMVVVD